VLRVYVRGEDNEWGGSSGRGTHEPLATFSEPLPINCLNIIGIYYYSYTAMP
jgi:hypothetical protein